MPKERSHRHLSSDRSKDPPYSRTSKDTEQCGSKKPSKSAGDKSEWEDAKCAICMEHPHNTVLLWCSSHDKGCLPYMCDTSPRHSNCFEQFCKSTPLSKKTDIVEDFSPPPNMKQLKNKLRCPLCRGEISGWVVVEAARSFMNSKARSCTLEGCDFMGTYKELRKHARREHPSACPTAVEPTRQLEWINLTTAINFQDLFSLTVDSLPGNDTSGIENPLPFADFSSFFEELGFPSDIVDMQDVDLELPGSLLDDLVEPYEREESSYDRRTREYNNRTVRLLDDRRSNSDRGQPQLDGLNLDLANIEPQLHYMDLELPGSFFDDPVYEREESSYNRRTREYNNRTVRRLDDRRSNSDRGQPQPYNLEFWPYVIVSDDSEEEPYENEERSYNRRTGENNNRTVRRLDDRRSNSDRGQPQPYNLEFWPYVIVSDDSEEEPYENEERSYNRRTGENNNRTVRHVDDRRSNSDRGQPQPYNLDFWPYGIVSNDSEEPYENEEEEPYENEERSYNRRTGGNNNRTVRHVDDRRSNSDRGQPQLDRPYVIVSDDSEEEEDPYENEERSYDRRTREYNNQTVRHLDDRRSNSDRGQPQADDREL